MAFYRPTRQALTRSTLAAAACTILAFSLQGFAQQVPPQQRLSADRYEGHSVSVFLSDVTQINADSTLKREWHVITDASSPVKIVDGAGVLVSYDNSRPSAGFFKYSAIAKIKHSEDVAAVEIRLHLFDPFGLHITTLAGTSVRDRKAGESSIDGDWRAAGEVEAAQVFSSVMYVSKVRTASGRVYEVDHSAVLRAIKKIGAQVEGGNQEPKR